VAHSRAFDGRQSPPPKEEKAHFNSRAFGCCRLDSSNNPPVNSPELGMNRTA
jgi:hypothetical protein